MNLLFEDIANNFVWKLGNHYNSWEQLIGKYIKSEKRELHCRGLTKRLLDQYV